MASKDSSRVKTKEEPEDCPPGMWVCKKKGMLKTALKKSQKSKGRVVKRDTNHACPPGVCMVMSKWKAIRDYLENLELLELIALRKTVTNYKIVSLHLSPRSCCRRHHGLHEKQDLKLFEKVSQISQP